MLYSRYSGMASKPGSGAKGVAVHSQPPSRSCTTLQHNFEGCCSSPRRSEAMMAQLAAKNVRQLRLLPAALLQPPHQAPAAAGSGHMSGHISVPTSGCIFGEFFFKFTSELLL